MVHRLILAALAAVMVMGCGGKDNPVAPPAGDTPPAGPAGSTVLFSEGFGGTLSKWETQYMVLVNDYYPQMRITTGAALAHTGTHSITSDSNRTALVYKVIPRLEPATTGLAHYIVGLQFYIMASALGECNFSVQFGQDNGSSGGLGKAFGFGFDKSDSIKTMTYDTWGGLSPEADSMLGPIQLNHWYKCNVEVDLGTPWNATWKLDDIVVQTKPLPTQEMNGIDRVLVFRGAEAGLAGADFAKQCYADDIVLYTK